MQFKKTMLLSFFVIAALPSYAQIRYIPAAARSFSVSLGGGAAMLFGDFKTKFFTPAARMNVDYNFTSYISAGLEGQIGRLTMSKLDIAPVSGMRVDNNFMAANANVRITWGRVFKASPKSILNGFYTGIGAGIIRNNVTANRSSALIDGQSQLAAGKRLTGTFFTVPINAGLDIDLSLLTKVKNLAVNLNYQHSFSTDDHLDGFRVLIAANRFPDNYGFLSVAAKYYFGRIKQVKKTE